MAWFFLKEGKHGFDKYSTVKKKPNGADISKNKEIFGKKGCHSEHTRMMTSSSLTMC